MALSTARIHRVRGRPPLLAAGIKSLIHSHSSSVRSLGYIFSFIYPFYTTCADFSDRLLDLTSLTLDEFQQLIPPFEVAFQARMAAWRLDGKPRTARQFSVYKNCPLPTPEDRLFFLLTYLKTYALQVVQGRLFGMGQSKASQRPPAKPEA